MYFDNSNNYYDINKKDYEIEIENYNDTDENYIEFRSNKLTTPIDGLNKGNMFKNLYSKYKNHEYRLKVNNKKDELLLKIQYHNFALKDINLYLDLHPNDKEMIKEFLTIKTNLEKLKKEYEKNYGVICITEIENPNKWTWIENPWPWDGGYYV